MSNFLKGMSISMPRRAQLARVAVAASVAMGAGVALHATRRPGRLKESSQQFQRYYEDVQRLFARFIKPDNLTTCLQLLHTRRSFYLPQPIVDAICGAVGEVSQIVLLYPLETIKVSIL